MTKCSECGYENMDGLDYCDGCGAKLAHPADGAPAPTAEPAPAAATAAAPAEPAPAPAEAAAPEPAPAIVEAPAAEPPAAEAPTGELNKPAAAPEPAPAMPAAFKARLSLIRGGRKGQEFPLEDGKNLIGRWDPETGSFPEVDLEQDDPEAKISRKHAMIIIENGKLTIEDIGSLNGTYVNRGNRLIPGTPVDLKTGDEIIIGKTFLKLVVDPIS